MGLFSKKVVEVLQEIKVDYRLELRKIVRSGKDITKDQLEAIIAGLGKFYQFYVKAEELLWDAEVLNQKNAELTKVLEQKNKVVKTSQVPLDKLRKELTVAEKAHAILVNEVGVITSQIEQNEARAGRCQKDANHEEEKIRFVNNPDGWIYPNQYGIE